MHFKSCIWAAFAAAGLAAAGGLPQPGADGKYTLTAPGIRAKVCSHYLY